MSRFRHLYILMVIVMIITVFTAKATAQSSEGMTSEPLGEEALIKDTEEYALAMDISLEEAIQRLSLQDVIGELEAQLTINEQNTYAGLWVQHQPEYRVVAQFTSDGEKTISQYLVDSLLAQSVEIRTVPISL